MISQFGRKIGITLFFLVACFYLFGQVDSSAVNNSPYSVIYNHLYYLQEENYDPGRAALSIPPGTSNRRDVAIQLKKILDGKGYYVDINRLPKRNNYQDSTANNEYIYFINKDEPRIYVERVEGQWYYSQTTIEQVPALFKEVFPFGTGFAQAFHGPFWDFEILDVTVAKWLGVLVLLLCSGLFFYLINWLARRIVTSFLKKRLGVPEQVNRSLSKMARIFGLFLTTKLLLYFLPMFQLPIQFNAVLIKGLGILGIFFLILFIVQISTIIFQYLDNVTKKTENTLDDQLLPVLSRIANIIIWAIGVIYILDYLAVNVTALLAGISIGGLAIALAAQDTVKNFFGSIMIFVDRPFQIGDWINFDDVHGVVEEVGVRSTRIRTFANSLVYVPNGQLADKVVNNMGLRQYRRFKTDIGVTYNTPPDRIDLFVKGIRKIIENHPITRKDFYEVHLNSFAESSINILVYCFFEAMNWTEELKARHEVMYAIMLLAKDLGVSFAFPSQSVYIESFVQERVADHSIGDSSVEPALDASMDKIKTYFQKKLRENNYGKVTPLGGE